MSTPDTPSPTESSKTVLDRLSILEGSPTLVLCFDGTGDQFDEDNSNIVKFFSMLPKGDRTRQLVYYQTVRIRPPLSPRLLGSTHFAIILDTAGDRICIFGFSRGAYTARSLAGMIHKVGLLPVCNHQQIPFAYKMYTTNDETGWKQSNAFKKTFSIDVDIEFLGVWDTVNSVGLIPKRLPFTTSNTIVRTFRHALSLDERRAKFKANLWNRPNDKEKLLSITDQKIHHNAKKAHPSKLSQQVLELKYSGDLERPTDVDEVWFAGCHCDVGGGSVDNDTPNNLARIPLRWMIRECFKTNSGIMFETEGLRSIGLDPDSLYPVVKPRPPALPIGSARIQPIPSSKAKTSVQTKTALPNFASASDAQVARVHKSEEQLDLEDELSPIYDELSLSWAWWILEVMPIKQRYQRSDDTWATYFGWNLGKGRSAPKHGIRAHRSVKARLEASTEQGGKYKPKAAFDVESTTWVD
ncbi:hypothetical protein DFH07DRAFT_907066 [Mycena maculata]|uniref:T6SS Phospholipase effector Tle1-like catalytic domain-containing protein n=1 Tax=Mycena maculata TaxID=230809 RepID=A0AAD7MJU6_9AGAR|nr:hypothetical protein DFH07DRAFT_907066 [Mycena maculata]